MINPKSKNDKAKKSNYYLPSLSFFSFYLIVSIFMSFSCLGFSNNHSVIFVHLGEKVLPCIFTTMKQARYLNQDSDIYLLADAKAHHSFQATHQDFLLENCIRLINMEFIPKTRAHLTFLKINKIDLSLFDGFWSFALQRFFYLFDFIKYKNLENIVHLESDSMLYIELKELLPLFKIFNTQIAAPFQSLVGCIPCFVFVKNYISFIPLIDHILYEMKEYKGLRPHIDVNDMQTLASFYRKFGISYITPLPVLMPEYGQYYSQRQSTFDPDNQTPLEFLSMNSCFFPDYIFDAATLGVFANGNDRRYFPEKEAGIIHYRSLFDPGYFSFFWGTDSQNKKVPYLTFKEKRYRIVNMHFHSKLPEGHTSYGENQVKFPTESHL